MEGKDSTDLLRDYGDASTRSSPSPVWLRQLITDAVEQVAWIDWQASVAMTGVMSSVVTLTDG